MKLSKISIILPVYNAEASVSRCLDSLCSQSYENFEIVCVENGSTDGSLDILQQYAARDSRVKLIHQDKVGVSVARNAALAVIQGDIVGFCDADDIYIPGAFQHIIDSFEKNKCDILITGYGYKCGTENEELSIVAYGGEDTCSGSQLQERMFKDARIKGFSWNKFFNKKMVEGVKFDDHLTHAEDLHFVSQVLHLHPQCNVLISPQVTYTYYINKESATQDPMRLLNARGQIWYMEAYEKIARLYTNDKQKSRVIRASLFRVIFENIKHFKTHPQIVYSLAKSAQPYVVSYLLCSKLPVPFAKRLRKCLKLFYWSCVAPHCKRK